MKAKKHCRLSGPVNEAERERVYLLGSLVYGGCLAVEKAATLIVLLRS